MKKYAFFCAVFAAFTLVISSAIAVAALKPGDQLVYTLSTSMSHGGQSINSKVTVNVDRVDKDGSAHANVSLDTPHMSSFKAEATITRFGEIVAKAADMTTMTGFSPPMNQKAAQAIADKQMALGAPSMLQMNLSALNAVAGAVARHKNLKIGDSWQAAGPGIVGDQISYKVTGRDQHLGHDSYVIALQSLPGASSTVTGTGYYDAAAHLVVAVHCEMNTPQGSQIADDALAQ